MIYMNDELIEKECCETDPNYGCKPHERKMDEYIKNNIVIIDKPKGPTSHQVSAWVRNILHAKKTGHAGTLDPGVTGVLIEATDNATKIIPALLNSGKEYVCLMKLHKPIEEDRIRKTAKKFTGTITQIPPVMSAVKRRKRQRTIYNLDILEIDGQYVLFRADVQAGTYIRKLCTDFGKELGVNAHMQELRRTRAGPFSEKSCVTLYDLKDAYEFWKTDKTEKYLRAILKPAEEGVYHLKKLIIKDSAVSAICHGAPLYAGGVCKLSNNIEKEDFIAILSLKGELVALGNSSMKSEEMAEKKQGVVAKISRVVINTQTYPKRW